MATKSKKINGKKGGGISAGGVSVTGGGISAGGVSASGGGVSVSKKHS